MSFEGPEFEPPHRPHGRGLPPWLEWTTAIAALVVSITSIVIAILNGGAMDKLVKANSFPYVFGGFSDATPAGIDRISVDLINNGVGPANEKSLTIRLGDRYVTSVPDLVRAVVGPAEGEAAVKALQSFRNGAHTRFIAAKDRQFIFWIDKTPQNARYWDMIDKSIGRDRSAWHIDFCYCSVFDECWAVHDENPTPVKACKRDERHEFLP
jgi:hypothetical protein